MNLNPIYLPFECEVHFTRFGKCSRLHNNINPIEFQNNNSFGLSGVVIGFLNGKNCTSNKNDYEVTTYCARNSKVGISAGSYGILPCGSVPPDAARLGFCIIGYSPIYDQFNDELLIFKEKNGLCRGTKAGRENNHD